jgi:hypothetical protein
MSENTEINELIKDIMPERPAETITESAATMEQPAAESAATSEVSNEGTPAESSSSSAAETSPSAVQTPPGQESSLEFAAQSVAESAATSMSEEQRTILSLREQLEEMAARTLGVKPDAKPAESATTSEASEVVQARVVAPEKGGVISFIETEEQFDEAMKTAEGFNKILTGVVQKSVETVLRSVPQMVVKLADSQITMRSAINEFYTHNTDLVASKAYVGMVANELAAKNPDWTLDKLLGNLGGEVRTRLKMVTSSVQQTKGGAEAKPAFVPKGGGGKPPSGPGLTGQDKEIVDLIS